MIRPPGAGAALLVLACATVAAAAGSELPLPTGGATLCFAGDRDTVTLSLEDGAYGYYFWLGVAAPSGERFLAGGTCREDEDGFVCPIDGDGGWFWLEPGSDGGILLRPETGLRLEPPGDGEDGSPPRLSEPHALAAAPLDRCG